MFQVESNGTTGISQSSAGLFDDRDLKYLYHSSPILLLDWNVNTLSLKSVTYSVLSFRLCLHVLGEKPGFASFWKAGSFHKSGSMAS